MTIRLSRIGAVGLGLALVAGAAGVAIAAEDPAQWYSGGNATVADPDNIASLKIVDASGVEVTSGKVSDPLGAFAVADGTVRAGDTAATLFVFRPSTSTAPGAWSGEQVSGTTRFSGTGAATAPTGAGSNPFVSLDGSLPLADPVAAYPNGETAPSFKGVYELRLRTSSTKGVAASYASAYVKVDGDDWTKTTAPALGDTPAVDATITPTWPSTLAYGKAASVAVTVKGGDRNGTGKVTLKSGSTTLASRDLVDGKATLTISKTALTPGSRTLTLSYAGDDHVNAGSTTKTYTVAKASPSRVTYRTVTKPTSRKTGRATVAVSVPSGLAKATGKVDLVIKRGSTTKRITGKVLRSGTVSITLPKLRKGTWKVTATYKGDVRYQAKSSAVATIKVTR